MTRRISATLLVAMAVLVVTSTSPALAAPAVDGAGGYFLTDLGSVPDAHLSDALRLNTPGQIVGDALTDGTLVPRHNSGAGQLARLLRQRTPSDQCAGGERLRT